MTAKIFDLWIYKLAADMMDFRYISWSSDFDHQAIHKLFSDFGIAHAASISDKKVGINLTKAILECGLDVTYLGKKIVDAYIIQSIGEHSIHFEFDNGDCVDYQIQNISSFDEILIHSGDKSLVLEKFYI